MSPTKPHLDQAPKRVTVLGSTGSVGANTIDLIERNRNAYEVEALTANRNVTGLADQAIKLDARMAVVADPDCYLELKSALSGTGIEAAAGPDALVDAAERPSDWVMAAIVGSAGLRPTLAAVRRGITVGLANKECLVSAGEFFVNEVRKNGAELLPVDSEHSAIYQVLDFDQADKIRRIILTASGGPFREFTVEQMATVTPEQAVAHPNWDMGAKISVDSATMMNKGLELIEAYHLFPVEKSEIDILVHPQSVVHSMVDYVDGSVLAQLGTPDMRTPIAYALAWPNRMEAPAPKLLLEDIRTLTFEPPDAVRFPALRLAREALQAGNSAPTVLNAANEVAVERFLNKEIAYLDIAKIVDQTLEGLDNKAISNLDDIAEVDLTARAFARSCK
ncbi:MAG: 1-deoxy-D-xylulose-5-phosphate reductoisomerase [Rhodospirillales bacterium]|jgi:1-deoxy-D-xylulose-5-phosphate reductoisomerase|tara:strand:+ start:1158 stop:2333 length:1176 start_codon:yes stop_codon:yes gene_type:complete